MYRTIMYTSSQALAVWLLRRLEGSLDLGCTAKYAGITLKQASQGLSLQSKQQTG
jgi:hypothetical protein